MVLEKRDNTVGLGDRRTRGEEGREAASDGACSLNSEYWPDAVSGTFIALIALCRVIAVSSKRQFLSHMRMFVCLRLAR